ncbi:MAG: N-succinylarginine dihydrolase [Halobacteriovorax sp.]|nr:N-succinylarginine dihydrolase [Halobacteriovorax sp.]
MSSYEVNFDGLVGPTHNYAGLSTGNVASMNNASDKSYPKAAAKQGLDKMLAVSKLGLKQGVLAPAQRPDLQTLRRLGFSGSEEQIVEKAFKENPILLNACYSASSMWTANAATVSPSADTADGKVHMTPANLVNKLHRSIESPVTSNILKATFNDEKVFSHHEALPYGDFFGDEGAANHTRFCHEYGEQGVEFFVYGKHHFDKSKPRPTKFEARHTIEASKAIARLHQLDPNKTVFAQQNPDVIDQGVFHNDVIGVGNKDVYFYHEQGLLNSKEVEENLKRAFGERPLHLVKVTTDQVPVLDAIKSYLFNSQLIALPNNETALIAPEECKNNPAVWNYIENYMLKETPIKHVHVFNVTQSMKNGGGPACLRLRVALKETELASVNQATLMDETLHEKLYALVDKHYREELTQNDLRDPKLINEVRSFLDELTTVLKLGSIYPFQQ